MDDLWGNAWGSPDDVKGNDNGRTITWPTSEKPRDDDFQEDDLAMPSWSTGPGIRWDEPSDTQSPLWSSAHHTTHDWSFENPSSGISLGHSSLTEPPHGKDIASLESEPQPSSPSSLRAQSDDISAPSPSREVSPTPVSSSAPSPEPSPPSSPDAFGTFTVGTEHSDAAPFTTTGGSLEGRLDANEWGSAWGSVTKDLDENDTQHASDEWESAKLRQLEMDRRVPPELLSRILLHLEELTEDAWPEPQDAANEVWQGRWHSGMDVDGLDTLLLRYIPTFTLPQLQPSGKNFTAKAMADAVKLSRNTALARTSPMSKFLAAKGSTAWETSVKSRVETSVDEVPLGWRILDKDTKKDEKTEESVKKSSGLLAGLWSRRTASSPSDLPGQEQSTPPPNITVPEDSHAVKALNQSSSMETANASLPTSKTPPRPSHTHTLSQDEDTHLLPSDSAVSRFLKRFSRARSSPRNSLALSSDDLEFLSDVRSNSSDPVHTVDELIAGLGSESESTESGALHGKSPPPLPPPPNVSTPPLHSLAAAARGNTLIEDTLFSPDDPHTSVISTLQRPTEVPTIPALSLAPNTNKVSDSPELISSDPTPAHPFPSTKMSQPSFDVSLLPVLSPQPNLVPPPVAQPRLRLDSAHNLQSFDISQGDDDFSEFCSSPADPPLLPFNVNSPSTGQGKVASLLSSQRLSISSSSPFDDLVHLMSSPTTGPLSASEPDAPRSFSFASSILPVTPSSPAPRESTPAYRASLDHPPSTPSTPKHSRSDSQQSNSPPKVMSSSPKQKAIVQGHQRTQSLLDLAAARKGRWPAPPSPLPQPLLPPPAPPERTAGEGPLNVDYFGTTPTAPSFTLPSSPPSGKSLLLPSLGNTTPSQVGSSKKDGSTVTKANAFDVIGQPRSGSPSLAVFAPPTAPEAGRAFSPPPLPVAVMRKSKTPSRSSTSTPVPLLPPPSGYSFAAAPVKPSPAQFSPESTPLALLMNNDMGKNGSLPAVSATPPAPAPIKGTGGLTAQDLSFFEGL
ncbi:hypothetical protein BC827DRAFT_1264129 [Russula dissimulans]|nr:hypothetical protein BC827DRAFT_1264129 [Russula dissimulans]